MFCRIVSRGHSGDAAGNRRRENYEHVVSQYKETNCFASPAQRLQIQSTIFSGLYFSGFEKGKPGFSSSEARVNLWLHTDNSMCRRGYKVMSKYGKHRISRFPQPPYSPEISRCGFWFFGMLKGILKDQAFDSSNEIEEAITRIGDDLTLICSRAFSRTG
jgi:hypothetical protein